MKSKYNIITAPLVEPGQPVPEFSLTDQSGKRQTLADYRGKWVVLYFYPRDNTPGCSKEACQFRDSSAEFAKRDAVVLGISPDSEASHGKFARKFGLLFPLLVDNEAKICGQYGVWRKKSIFGVKHWGVVRTTYLIDPAGNVAFRWDKVSVSGHDAQILDTLDAKRAES